MNVNRAIDEYILRAELPFDNQTMSLPVHLIATNTDDNSKAETWLTVNDLRAHLRHVCPGNEHIADGWIQQLEVDGYTEFGAAQPEHVPGAATNRAKFKAEQLIPFGFSVSELRPWRVEAMV